MRPSPRWKSAAVTDLWSGTTTTESVVSVALPEGDGVSRVFRLRESAPESF
jgi:hypothetical protein